jgi:hypothetical protein
MVNTCVLACGLGLLLLVMPNIIASETPASLSFSAWSQVVFEGETTYQLQHEATVAAAHSFQSASGLALEKPFSLEQQPVLHWSWKVDVPITSDIDERSKSGDDFVARVYVVKKGFFPWQTLAINYVWARQAKQGEYWPNPYTSNAIMIALDSSSFEQGSWRSHQRNIQQDFLDYHGEKIDEIDAIAIMTDTDNTKAQAKAAYRDFYWSASE